jgi:hypothetical protein
MRSISRVLCLEKFQDDVISLDPRLPVNSCSRPEHSALQKPKGKRTPGPIFLYVPIWLCLRWGLPCPSCCHHGGALLPHHFTLTRYQFLDFSGIFSVALSLELPRPGVTRHRVFVKPGLSSTWLKQLNVLTSQRHRVPHKNIINQKSTRIKDCTNLIPWSFVARYTSRYTCNQLWDN